MGTPSTTARTTPPGIVLEDGFSATIAFERDPDVNFWEKTVSPPGIDGGDAIATTTMHNTLWRTMAARSLQTLTEMTTKVAYDPVVYSEILALVNQPGSITVHFPDGSTLDFFGYLRLFEPDDLTEGEQPEATVTITPTNTDPSDSTEAAPVLTEVSGT